MNAEESKCSCLRFRTASAGHSTVHRSKLPSNLDWQVHMLIKPGQANLASREQSSDARRDSLRLPLKRPVECLDDRFAQDPLLIALAKEVQTPNMV
jgi:hypothetical protein